MPTHRIPLPAPLPAARTEELAKRIYYVSPAIEDFTLIDEAGQITAVEVRTADTAGTADPAELARKLGTLVTKDVLSQRLSEAGVVWTSPHPSLVREGVFAALEDAGEVVEMGEGLYATGELLTSTLAALDRRLAALAVDGFGAVRYRYPTLVPTSVLRKAGYLDAFPQFLMTASHFRPDVDTYDAFVTGLAGAPDEAAHIDRHSEHLGYCLPPTMCFHTYHQWRGRQLGPEPTVVTSRGKSFRYESRYRHAMERLWDFTIREIVFLGDRDTVAEQRRGFLAATCGLVEELGLAGRVEVANDPFFCNDLTPERVLAQRMMELKYELRLPVEGGRTVAAGSFNIHGATFGTAFGITLPGGEPAHTACVGIGLERLSYAFFCQHGTDPDRWPATVRSLLTP
ncbi:hypothetical protein [Kitasatospora acidiphila]|uniref:hypothetical protein n=1 Tax=Kitasatospora acidiphila TaxID=2567942 RepID=UPI003C765A24